VDLHSHSVRLNTSRYRLALKQRAGAGRSFDSRRPDAPTIRAEAAAGASELFHLTGSKAEEIDVLMTVDEEDVEKRQQALDCSVTYRETIEAHQDGSAGPGAISRARRCLRSTRRRTIRRSRAW
jgi:t-SNARE complex subunit (syntaxin)